MVIQNCFDFGLEKENYYHIFYNIARHNCCKEMDSVRIDCIVLANYLLGVMLFWGEKYISVEGIPLSSSFTYGLLPYMIVYICSVYMCLLISLCLYHCKVNEVLCYI